LRGSILKVRDCGARRRIETRETALLREHAGAWMMAKVREQSDGLSGPATRKSDGLTGTNATKSSMVDQTSPPAATGWRGRIGGLLVPRRTLTTAQSEAQAARPGRPQGRWGKLLFGFMVYLLGSFLLQPLILLVFQWLHINPAARQPFFPAGTWVVGTANIYTLVYFVFLAVFIWALFRFNIIPRDPFGARANYQQRQAGGGASGSSAASGATTSTTGGRAARAATAVALSPSARRHAGRRRLPMTDGTSAPVKARMGFFARARAAATGRQNSTPAARTSDKPAAKPQMNTATTSAVSAKTSAKTAANGGNGTAKPAVKSAASATNGASGMTKSLAVAPKTSAKAPVNVPTASAPAAKRPSAGVAVATPASASHDDHYDRIKARQRAQRRKH
jgi:hypothetical protein